MPQKTGAGGVLLAVAFKSNNNNGRGGKKMCFLPCWGLELVKKKSDERFLKKNEEANQTYSKYSYRDKTPGAHAVTDLDCVIYVLLETDNAERICGQQRGYRDGVRKND
jgi:hypothetical protein